MLKNQGQPSDAVKIASVLPSASPRRLKRIVKSIPTPTSESVFTEEEAIALMLQLGLTRDKYITLRKALQEKGVKVCRHTTHCRKRRKVLYPHPLKSMNIKYKASYHKVNLKRKKSIHGFTSPFKRIRKYADSDSRLHLRRTVNEKFSNLESLLSMPEYAFGILSASAYDLKYRSLPDNAKDLLAKTKN
ncbi:hypothetical protein EVAR_91995_1 [Eumeta japonica]|uniref:Uncharacterized protein n=1 Tax=Eumeta variegata TaxID=151549 RepID=A0A4C1SXQ6_EUMVA|nr:hypothetical protein EVAR_91995_1 [Eumeta japonica]